MAHDLTPREIEALTLAAAGHSSKSIAKLWGYVKASCNNDTGPSHVRRVWRHAFEKLGADNIVQAVAMAIRRKIIQ